MRKHVLPVVIGAAVVLSGLTAPAHAAGGGSAEPPAADASFRQRVQQHRPTGRLQVRFKDGVGTSRREAALAKVAARGLRVRVDKEIPGLNAALIDVSNARAVQALLRANPDVKYVEPESRYRALQTEPVAPELKEIGADVVHAPASGPANTGAGQQIAILDSPVSALNTDLDNGKVVYSGNFANDDAPDIRFEDGYGYSMTDAPCTAAACPHGTAVAAAAAASAGDGGVVGVAPGASVRSYNVFRRFVYTDQDTGAKFETVSASSADIAAAIVAVKNHAATHQSIVALNMSLGGPFDNQLIRDAIAALRAGAPRVTVVVAAGNDGGERANFPAGNAHVLSVGATGQVTGDDCSESVDPATPWTLASFSNRGDVDVVAPGHCVSLWYPEINQDTGAVIPGTTSVSKISGTSFAAPMVAGVAALLAASSTPLTGDAARAAIIAGATGPADGDDVAYGVGHAHAPDALALGAGTQPFTAIALERGGQVASSVGKRNYEVIRVDPTKATTPAVPTPTVTAGFGAVSTGTATLATGVSRRSGTFSASTATPGAFAMSTTTEAGDTATVPMRLLDSTNAYEGVPTGSGVPGSAPLKFGSRSMYVRSFRVPSTGARATWSYTYGEASVDPEGYRGAQLFLWEPTTDGGVADAAMEPVYGSTPAPGARSGTDEFQMGGANDWGCTYLGGDPNLVSSYAPCRLGRFLIGFVAFDPTADSSASTSYALTTRYATPTLTVPASAATSSATGWFKVAWGGAGVSVFDVEYAVRTKVGGTWTLGAWQQWKTGTTARSAAFGYNNAPRAVVPGTTYHFRVRGAGMDNPRSAYATSKHVSAPLDDRSGSIAYSTGSTAWTGGPSSSRWKGTFKRATAAGARATLTAETSGFTVIGDKCSTCGQIKVYLDGVYKKTVDTYGSSTAVRQVLYSVSGLSGGIKSRRITLVVVGTKSRPKIVLDGIGTIR